MSPEDQNIALAESRGWQSINSLRDSTGQFHLSGWTKDDSFANTRGYIYSVNGIHYCHIPDYGRSHDEMYMMEDFHGVHDKGNVAFRVKWVGHLREVVSRRMPRNAVNQPLISDIDLLGAKAEERREALVRALGLWPKQ